MPEITLLKVTTAKGKTVHGFQLEGSPVIVCNLCHNRGKLHTSNNLRDHVKHVLSNHPEIL